MNLTSLKLTAKSIAKNYEGIPFFAVVPKSATKEEIEIFKEICPIIKGKNTIASLINTGIKNGNDEWNLIIFAGNWIKSKVDYKYFKFINSDNDVLFPIVNGKYNFLDGSLNGLMINKKFFNKINKLSEKEDLDICKLNWAMSVIENKGVFKAILGLNGLLN